MSKSTKKLITVAFLLVATAQLGRCDKSVPKIEGFGGYIDEPVLHVMNKLERYALGLVGSSSVTIDELRSAYLQYKNWSPKGREFMIKEMPLMRLFADFALVPMDNFELQVGELHGQDPEFDNMYIKRLEHAYKEFRPGFLGQSIGNQYHRSAKIDKAIDSLIKAPGHEPLTRKILEDAKKEIDAHLGRLYEMEVLDDIYAQIGQFKFLMNALNRGYVVTFLKEVLPFIDEIDKSRGAEKLRERFERGLPKKNYSVKYDGGRGRLIWYGDIDAYP